VVSVPASGKAEFTSWMDANGCSYTECGTVTGSNAIVDGEDIGSITGLKELYDTSIEKILHQ